MADKADKMKARLPRGFVDRVPDDLRATEKMTATIREVYDLYGFEPVETPLISIQTRLESFSRIRTARMRAYSRFRTMTSSGCRYATI